MANKFDVLTREHLLAAATQLDTLEKLNWSEYHVFVTEKATFYPFKQLVRTALEIALDRKLDDNYFQSNDNYRRNISERFGYVIEKSVFQLSFFNKKQLNTFLEYAGQKYRQDNPNDREAGQAICKEIFEKSNYWAERSLVDDFVAEPDNSWQKRGIYQSYSWTKIYRAADKGKKVFFTVGVSSDEKALVYKLDRYHDSSKEENKLTSEQDEIFRERVSEVEGYWNTISFDVVDTYDWTRLTEETKDFIERFAYLYDEIIEAIWNKIVLTKRPANTLFLQPVPAGIVKGKRTGRQYEGNADYDALHKFNKEIGEGGEQLVIKAECQRLAKEGRPDLANKVHKVLDWKGYDILSYRKDGTELFIEVKTTVGNAQRPFFLSLTEKKTMHDNQDQYCLYRIYNYNISERNGDYFVLDGDFSERVKLEPTCYGVTLLPGIA